MNIRIKTGDGYESPYVKAGFPKHCFLPSCRQAFVSTCVHGADKHYYCSQECADQARTMDLSQVEEMGRRRA